ncbi:MAG: hypothetical protein M0Z66_05735 [Thermaerobacter sp.]|nr:hypothetical protein [Thermaerobacter sp.]
MSSLGSLTWYTLREVEVTREQIRRGLQAAGLDEKFTPKAVLPSDAFRRATSEVETTRLPQGDGTFVNLLVREVHSDKDEILRHLVRETVDGGNRRLKYEQVAEIRLDKASNTCQTYSLLTLSKQESEALDEARKRYDRYRDAYQSRHLREIVLDVLQEMNPVAVRPSGGVYFVPVEHDAQLGKLQSFVRALGNESDLWTMPVVDSADSRAVIRSSLGQEVEDTTQRVINEMGKLLQRKGEVSEADQRRALVELHRLQELTNQYRDILQDKLFEAQANIEVAERQVRSLLAA